MKFILSLCSLLGVLSLTAQDLDSLMNTMEQEEPQEFVPIFQSPKLVLQQTNVVQKEHQLTFWIGHRFGDIGGEDGGIRTLFGLDGARDIHIGFDYGLSRDLSIGIGRSKHDETYSLQAKWALIRQTRAGVPVSLTVFGQSSVITREELLPNEFSEQQQRFSHFLQFIAARRFSNSLSLMLSPGYLLRERVQEDEDQEDFLVLGLGGRLRITRSLSLIADYMLVNGLHRPADLQYRNPLGVGLEIETGGHVFSLNFQNSAYIVETNYIPYTTESWSDGGVRFGFSISRNFYLGPRDKLPYE